MLTLPQCLGAGGGTYGLSPIMPEGVGGSHGQTPTMPWGCGASKLLSHNALGLRGSQGHAPTVGGLLLSHNALGQGAVGHTPTMPCGQRAGCPYSHNASGLVGLATLPQCPGTGGRGGPRSRIRMRTPITRVPSKLRMRIHLLTMTPPSRPPTAHFRPRLPAPRSPPGPDAPRGPPGGTGPEAAAKERLHVPRAAAGGGARLRLRGAKLARQPGTCSP